MLDSTKFHFSGNFIYMLLKRVVFLVVGLLQILGKCEFLNPGGSVKDRVAVKIIEEVSYSVDFGWLRNLNLRFFSLDSKTSRAVCISYKNTIDNLLKIKL